LITTRAHRRQQIDNARAAGWPNPIFSRGDRIRVLVDQNPKRGTARLRFALYRTGMSVGEYLDAAAEAYPRLAYRAMGDLSWDAGQGWIAVG
jgi:hypothetical protein